MINIKRHIIMEFPSDWDGTAPRVYGVGHSADASSNGKQDVLYHLFNAPVSAVEDAQYDVFLCYRKNADDSITRQNAQIAENICSFLQREGCSVFLASATQVPGDAFGAEYGTAMQASKVVLIIDAVRPGAEPVSAVPEDSDIQSLFRRAQVALEDEEWEKADSCYESVLDIDFENGEAYFGKLLASQKVPNRERLFESLKAKYEADEPECLTACERDEEHISEKAESSSVPVYLEKDELLKLYEYDLTYKAFAPGRIAQREKQLAELNSNKYLNRARLYAKGVFKERLESDIADLVKTLNERVITAQAQDAEKVQAKQECYQTFLEETDSNVEKLYAEARDKRELEYQERVRAMKSASQSRDFYDISAGFKMNTLSGYKDSDALAEQCLQESARLESQEKKASEQKASRIKRRGIILIVLAAVAFISYFVLTNFYTPYKRYKDAEALMNAGYYNEAGKAFYSLWTYRDSEDKMNACIEALDDIDYQAVIRLMDEGYYKSALWVLDRIPDYRDSAELAEQCQTALKDRQYRQAEAMMQEGEYTQAIAEFNELGVYLNSVELIQQCRIGIRDQKYDSALAVMEEENFEEAIELFEAMDGYRESEAMIVQCREAIREKAYNDAVALYDNGDEQGAYEALLALGGYKDSAERAEDIRQEYYSEQVRERITSANIGDVFVYGRYEQDGDLENGAEDIEWLVVEKSENSLLLVSRWLLDSRPYNDSFGDVTWETSSLRSWLNGEFLQTAFTNPERSFIPETTVTNAPNPVYGTDSGPDTMDWVFLLSLEEVSALFESDADRACTSTAYAKERGARVDDNGSSWYWLRTAGGDAEDVAGVNAQGAVFEVGSFADNEHGSVRPVIRLTF